MSYSFVGKRVVEVRMMNREEMDREGWDYPTTVIIFDDGAKLYASRDSEGNSAGQLFGTLLNDESCYVGSD